MGCIYTPCSLGSSHHPGSTGMFLWLKEMGAMLTAKAGRTTDHELNWLLGNSAMG